MISKKIAVQPISNVNKELYRLLLPLEMRPYFDNIDNLELFAVGVDVDTHPIGVGLLRLSKLTKEGEVLALSATQQGILEKILESLEMICKEQGRQWISLDFVGNARHSQDLFKSLENRGWSDPKIWKLRYFFDSYTFNPPWFKKLPELPRSTSLFVWGNISKKEIESLKDDEVFGRFPLQISPFKEGKKHLPKLSLGLRQKGTVMGWSLLYELSPDTLEYLSLYIRPEFQFSGLSIRLLAETILLQKKSPYRWAIFEVNLKQISRSWWYFIEKRLAPYSLKCVEIYESHKQL